MIPYLYNIVIQVLKGNILVHGCDPACALRQVDSVALNLWKEKPQKSYFLNGPTSKREGEGVKVGPLKLKKKTKKRITPKLEGGP